MKKKGHINLSFYPKIYSNLMKKGVLAQFCVKFESNWLGAWSDIVQSLLYLFMKSYHTIPKLSLKTIFSGAKKSLQSLPFQHFIKFAKKCACFKFEERQICSPLIRNKFDEKIELSFSHLFIQFKLD